MVVRGSRQETLSPGFVLLGTRQHGVLVILRELVLPGGFDLVSLSLTIFFNCKYTALALPIRAFTSPSDPPCSTVIDQSGIQNVNYLTLQFSYLIESSEE
ncbi:unnamed protein product [Schistosoma margrebowiei]|uniref:Uncharacterized protein n=1 Tax=Schistosoma margrebowiei TaxID=48269 RepID=A0A183LMF8_9TREM|nr:unnamed protein product [Schistosoma margrebowiei]